MEQKSEVSEILIHPDYDEETVKNDICLLYLKTELNLNGNDVKSIDLEMNDPGPETKCDISGWGALDVSYTRGQKCNHFQQ